MLIHLRPEFSEGGAIRQLVFKGEGLVIAYVRRCLRIRHVARERIRGIPHHGG